MNEKDFEIKSVKEAELKSLLKKIPYNLDQVNDLDLYTETIAKLQAIAEQLDKILSDVQLSEKEHYKTYQENVATSKKQIIKSFKAVTTVETAPAD